MTAGPYAGWMARRRWRQLDAAERLAADARRMDAPGGGDTRDALDLISLSSSVYRYACRDGVRQAVQAGATYREIVLAFGMSISDTQDLIDRIRARDRELAPGGWTAFPSPISEILRGDCWARGRSLRQVSAERARAELAGGMRV
ncbi:hypothetical protein ACFWRV_19870 [Streptomyces sp. NPDC058576]|uniref:hypothetical protein n=1 Tax=Streptomyces sp. NPDC058576 TaxID=3346547 RepID=UPI00365DC438